MKLKSLLLAILVIAALVGTVYVAKMLLKEPTGGGGEQAVDMTDWQEYHNDAAGYSYRYPLEFTPDYISVQDWPPVIAVSDGNLDCPSQEFVRRINGHRYCVESQSEGAAGSIYTASIYSTEQAGKLVTVALTVREVQCANYDDPEKTACETERANFDLDALIDSMVRTIVLDP